MTAQDQTAAELPIVSDTFKHFTLLLLRHHLLLFRLLLAFAALAINFSRFNLKNDVSIIFINTFSQWQKNQKVRKKVL
jgi:hypothetical protein